MIVGRPPQLLAGARPESVANILRTNIPLPVTVGVVAGNRTIMHRAAFSERILPIAVLPVGLFMTGTSVSLLLNAANLGVFMHKMLGLIGVLCVNSVILSYVAIRIILSKENDATRAEKIFLLGLSFCTGIALVIANAFGL